MNKSVDVDKMNSIFSRQGDISSQDLDVFADDRFSSLDVNTGNEVFKINRRSARWLLHNLNHEYLTERQAKNVLCLSKQFAREGNKSSWSKKPIKINKSTCMLEDGVVRLYSIALMKNCDEHWNVSVPIQFIEEE